MKISQIANPFAGSVPSSKGGALTIVIVLAIIGGIIYYLFKTNKLRFEEGNFVFNF